MNTARIMLSRKDYNMKQGGGQGHAHPMDSHCSRSMDRN